MQICQIEPWIWIFATNHLGSVLNSPLGGLLRAYGPFGSSTMTGKTLSRLRRDEPLMYGFTGRQFDSESGLYYYRARSYNPDTGRFMQKDPIGFRGGDFNLYRYAGNNPIDRTDPSGLCSLSATDGTGYSPGYLDLSFTFGAGFGITIGVQIFDGGYNSYYGAGITFSPGASVLYNPGYSYPGLYVGATGAFGPAYSYTYNWTDQGSGGSSSYGAGTPGFSAGGGITIGSGP